MKPRSGLKRAEIILRMIFAVVVSFGWVFFGATYMELLYRQLGFIDAALVAIAFTTISHKQFMDIWPW